MSEIHGPCCTRCLWLICHLRAAGCIRGLQKLHSLKHCSQRFFSMSRLQHTLHKSQHWSQQASYMKVFGGVQENDMEGSGDKP